MDDHVGERDLLDELEAGEDHPVLPEADDLARRDVEIARVEALQVRCVVRPAERRERPERRREPRVEDVRVALELRLPALRASLRLGLGDGDVAVGAVPDGQLVPPPELPRDVPVGRVGERVDREAVLRLGVVAHAARLQSLDRRRAELVHAAPPLERDQRLDAALAALADGDRVAVGLTALDEAALLAPGQHAAAGFLLIESCKLAGLLIRIYNLQFRKGFANAQNLLLGVVEVWRDPKAFAARDADDAGLVKARAGHGRVGHFHDHNAGATLGGCRPKTVAALLQITDRHAGQPQHALSDLLDPDLLKQSTLARSPSWFMIPLDPRLKRSAVGWSVKL